MTYGPNDVRDAIGVHSRTELTHIVLPEQIFKLPDLHGFLSYPEAFPVASITIAPFQGDPCAPGFLLRKTPPSPVTPPGGVDVASDGTLVLPSLPEDPGPEHGSEVGPAPLDEGPSGPQPSESDAQAPLDPAAAALLSHDAAHQRRLHRLRRAGSASGPEACLSQQGARGTPEDASEEQHEGDAAASGGMAQEAGETLTLSDDPQILQSILEEDEAAEEKRRQAHEARLERERELMAARHMRDSVGRDQIDIALEPDEPDL